MDLTCRLYRHMIMQVWGHSPVQRKRMATGTNWLTNGGRTRQRQQKKAKPFTATLYLSRAATVAAKALASSQATPSLQKGPIKL